MGDVEEPDHIKGEKNKITWEEKWWNWHFQERVKDGERSKDGLDCVADDILSMGG